jgi:23S rRNA (adenine2503-C2)-methyltransferase
MKLLQTIGDEKLATVYIAELDSGQIIEFVESVQPPYPRAKKWVLIVSTLAGCPVNCPICDAGGFYKGKLSKDDILAQIDYMVTRHFPERIVPVDKFKIQFARMGDPAFNMNVIAVLNELPQLYQAPALMPCISTIAPQGVDRFFDNLLDIKQHLYPKRFQMQFSIHSTDDSQRDKLIPVRKWDFDRIAEYGRRFYQPGDRKIALNFALAKDSRIEPAKLISYFDPEIFLIKLTPVNPTYSSETNGIESFSFTEDNIRRLEDSLAGAGYEVIVSIGELRENDLGSNCGQYVTRHMAGNGERISDCRIDAYKKVVPETQNNKG